MSTAPPFNHVDLMGVPPLWRRRIVPSSKREDSRSAPLTSSCLCAGDSPGLDSRAIPSISSIGWTSYEPRESVRAPEMSGPMSTRWRIESVDIPVRAQLTLGMCKTDHPNRELAGPVSLVPKNRTSVWMVQFLNRLYIYF